MSLTTKQKGFIFLWIATLLFAAANAVIDKLGMLGAAHPIHSHNPISFCNVLFLGNLIAGFIFLGLNYKSWRLSTLKEIKLKHWGRISLIAIFATILGPVFYFLAIMLTLVINVVLISTTEIAWTLVLGYLIFKEKPSGLTLISTFLAVIGVGVTFYLHQHALMSQTMRLRAANIGSGWFSHWITGLPKGGEICALLGAFFSIIGDQLTKKYIGSVPRSFYNTYRTFAGAIIFFFVALSIFGWGHFADLFSPFLWAWMLFYGAIIVALAIYTWSRAAGTASTDSLAIASAFSPVAGVIFAFLIVGEIPDMAQIIGGGVIVIGIAVGLYDSLRTKKPLIKKPTGFHGI